MFLESAPLRIHIYNIINISRYFITQSLKLFVINWCQHKGKKTLQLYYQFIDCPKDSDIAHMTLMIFGIIIIHGHLNVIIYNIKM